MPRLPDLELDPVLRELAIMEVTHLEGSEYEWVQPVGITKAVARRPLRLSRSIEPSE